MPGKCRRYHTPCQAFGVCMWVTQSGHLSTPPPPQADAEKGEDGASNGRLGRLADKGRERHLPAPGQGAPALIRMRRGLGRSHWPQSESTGLPSRHPVSAEPCQSESVHCESSKAVAPDALLSGQRGSPSPEPTVRSWESWMKWEKKEQAMHFTPKSKGSR